MRIFWNRERHFIFGFGKFLLSGLMAILLVGTTASPGSAAPGDVQVSVFSFPGLTEGDASCADEVDNLEEIITRIPGYTVDRTITSLADGGGTTLLDRLNASRFFFVPDMEGSFTPSNSTNFPSTAVTAFQTWLSNGGVIVMTGTYGSKDVDFLNKVTGWSMTSQTAVNGATRIDANTSGTPFGEVGLNGVTLGTPSATDAIGPGNAPNFKALWGTSSAASVATMTYGSGTIIFMGWDFYNAGYNGASACPGYSDNWTQKIVPAALKYASQLSQSGLANATTTGGDLKYTFSQNGDAYYIIVPSASLAPTNAQIKAMVDYGTATVSRSDTAAISANVERVFNVTGLTPATDYKAYIVTEYLNSGSPTFSTQQVVEFSTKPGIPTVVSVNPDHGKMIANLTPYGTETNFEYSIDAGTTWVSRSPASTATNWEITGLTNGTTYTVQFRSAYRSLRGATTSSFTVTPAAQPASLTNLTSSIGTLSPSFVASTHSYTLSVENAVTSMTFRPTSTGNTITVSGRPCTSGQDSSAISLEVGTQPVTISVTRSGVTDPTIYTVQVTRASASQPSSYSAPVVYPTPVTDIKVSKGKDANKSILKVELPEPSKRNPTTKFVVKLFDSKGAFIKQLEVPAHSDVKTAEIEVDLKFGTFDAAVVAVTAAGVASTNYATGKLTNFNTVSALSPGGKVSLLGEKLLAPISFAPDSAKINATTNEAIAKLIASKEGLPGRFMVTGFVKSAGRSKQAEKQLATARAKTVALAFAKAGSKQWVQYFGFGSSGAKSDVGNSRAVEIRWIPTE